MNLYSSPNHYKLEEVDNGYTFTTINQEKYFVYFQETGELFADSGYEVFCFNIERVQKLEIKGDVKRHVDGIGPTIAEILERFFQKRKKAIITQCETSDKHQAARARLFDKWFEAYNHNKISKQSGIVNLSEEESTTVSIYYNPNDTDVDLLISDFISYLDISNL